MHKITINDVAEAAGVSIKTVSRVINREPNVRPVTQERVQQVIDKLGYHPSPSARSLAGNYTYIIGLVYSNPTPSYVHAVQTGTLAACREQGYDLLIHPCDHNNPDFCNEVAALHRQHKLDGLILTPPITDQQELIATLKEQNTPLVNISPIDQNSTIPFVQTNEQEAAYQLTRHLLSLGHRKIGFILGPPDHVASKLRLEGFRQALAEIGIRPDKSYLAQGQFNFESGKSATQTLLQLNPRPTAIFASNDSMAAGAMVIAHQQGLSLPQELSIVGFDDSPTASRLWPTLTTVKLPVYELAKNAAKMLIDNIRGKPFEEIDSQPQCELVIRESTAEAVSD